jgi:probable HAF family extracellular repeat protein
MKSLAVSACTILLFGAATTAVAAKATYFQITGLGNLANDPANGATFVSALNDRGEAVGQSFDKNLQARAYLWRDRKMTDLGDFLGRLTGLEATSINQRSQVVGSGLARTGNARAFFWDHGVMLVLPSLWVGGNGTYAWNINDRGDIVGAAIDTAGVLRAIRWVAGLPVAIGNMPDGRIAVQAFDINEHGQIVGYAAPGGKVAYAHAFSWKSGKFTDLGTLPRTQLSFANAVNDKGQVVGQSYDTTRPGTSRAFIWEDGVMQDLGVPVSSHTRSEARAISKKGSVVGTSGVGTVAVAWLWREGVIRDLNKLITPSNPNRAFVKLTGALAINDREEITAEGVDSRHPGSLRAYLLTPTKK